MKRFAALSKAQTLAEFEYWDGRLHQTIIAAARNGLLASLYDAINTVRLQPEWAKLKERTVTPECRATFEEQHRQSSPRSKSAILRPPEPRYAITSWQCEKRS